MKVSRLHNPSVLIVLGILLFPLLSFGQAQPGPMSWSSPIAYAGNLPCSVLTFENSPDMLVDVEYTFQGSTLTGSVQLDSNSQWTYCPGHYDVTGTYTFLHMKNTLLPDWIDAGGVTYTLNPPKPTSFAFTPSTFHPPQNITLSAGNGEDVTLSIQYQFNGGPIITIAAWPTLDSTGSFTMLADNCTPAGITRFVAVKNSLNGDDTYLYFEEPVPQAQAITTTTVDSVSPSGAAQGWSGTVNMTGKNLCSVALSTTWPGLTFTNVSSNGSSATATFIVASNAAVGTAPITVTTTDGTTSFNFPITGFVGPTLSKEYIYLGPRVIAVEGP
jgi:hypothetical protein